MNSFEKFIYAISKTMEEPAMYSLFHIVSIVLMVALLALLIWKCRNCSEKTFRILFLVAWIVVVLFEVYKQIVFSFNYDEITGVVTWDYQWYAFPFQLCSTPLYVFPFVAFLPEGKVRDAFIAFIGTFSLFGGLSTMIFPATVFVETIGINIQTMVHHGIQVALGIFAMVREREKLNFKYFLKGVIVYVGVVAVAMILNATVRPNLNEGFNMLYINKVDECSLPLVGDVIKPNVPYIAFLAIYILGFVGIALAIFYIEYAIIKGVARYVRRKGMYTYEKQREDEKPRVYSYQKQKAKEKPRTYSYQKNKK